MQEIAREARLLVVEDEPRMQRLLQSQLSLNGWEVQVVGTARDAIQVITEESGSISLILLDIGLPDGDGLEVCRRIRKWSNVPIILVTAADTPQLKVAALELGADDYLTKPFHTGELMARIRAVLRRARTAADTEPTVAILSVIEIDDLTVDLDQRTVLRKGTTVSLTKLEFDLLREFVTHLDRVLTYSHLLQAVWGAGYEDIRVVHVHVSHLRRKLEPDVTGPRHLLTLPGVGYRFRSSTG
ncbi:MAG: response regulator transcription factor [Armatimonadota bacterium]